MSSAVSAAARLGLPSSAVATYPPPVSWGRQAALGLRRVWWRWRRPVTRGARVVLVDDVGRLCLVRHSYGQGWYLPGGALRRREEPEEGARREAREELGLDVDLTGPVGTYSSTAEGKRDTIWVFSARTRGAPRPASPEIAECSWFSPNALPEGTSPATRRRPEEWAGIRQPEPIW